MMIIKKRHGANGGAFSSSRRLYESIQIRNVILTEAIDDIVADNEKGGIIILSTEVNAIEQAQNKFINWIKRLAKSFKNRLTSTKKIDKIAQENKLLGWTIGRFLDGRYTSKNGTPFGENSLSVELIGIDSDLLIKIAEELCRVFEQETVLVKDYNSGNILFVNGE